jgi:ribose/xylose/arabinose/galactoside ABC-type transport system permease subunit
MTSSRQLDFPREILDFGYFSVFGVPLPVIIFALVVWRLWVG